MNKSQRMALLLVVPVLLLAGCCARISASAPPDRLHVVRTIQSPGDPTQIPPGDWMITDAAAAQKVANAIDALLPITDQTRFCPPSNGAEYSLTFLRGQRVVLRATAEGRGCGALQLSSCDVRQTDADFWNLLGQLLNTPLP